MSKPIIHCVTGNQGKWQIFQNTLGGILELVQTPLETPEIQSFDVKDVASYSARLAARELNFPVLKTDVGYYIESLNGFPGPFVKWINQTLVEDQILAMMHTFENRNIVIREALAYAEIHISPPHFRALRQ